MALRPSWAVMGGTADAASARRMLWSATNGASGVRGASDLKVSALAVPGPAVNVRTGGSFIESTYQVGESYDLTNDATLQIPVTGGLATATTYIVIGRISDPEFNHTPEPDNPETATYNSIDVITAAALPGVTDPYIKLAQIQLPANTATITNDMITDLREVANPRSLIVPRANALITSETEQLHATGPDGEFFPNAGGVQKFDIPKWATRLIVRADLGSLLLPTGNATGRLWIGWGDKATQTRYENNTQEYGYNNPSSGDMRLSTFVSDYMVIDAKYRGAKDVPFAMFGRVTSGPGATMDALTGVDWRVTFLELPDPSYS